MHQKKRNHDNVVAVGQVEDATIQVLIPPGHVDVFMWRIIRKDGNSVTSGMVKYNTIQEAMEAALLIVMPDATPVEYTEPDESDYTALNEFLFGFKKGDPLASFQKVLSAHAFLVSTLEILNQAKDKMHDDYKNLAALVGRVTGPQSDEARLVGQLAELAEQSQTVMIELCERDLVTLSSFIAAFLR